MSYRLLNSPKTGLIQLINSDSARPYEVGYADRMIPVLNISLIQNTEVVFER